MRREIVYQNGVAVFAKLDPLPGMTQAQIDADTATANTINASAASQAYVAALAAKGQTP